MWVGQGLLAVVNTRGQQEPAERVRTGQVVADLLRPVDLMAAHVAADVGRAGHAALTRFVVPVAVGLPAFDPYLPAHAWTYPLLAVSVLLAVRVFVFFATVAFWWIDVGAIANAFTCGGKDVSAYPMTVFGGWFRRFFAYGLGFAFVAYLPALAMLGRSDPLGVPDRVRWCSPLTASSVAVLAGWFWRTGVRHYRSTGA